MDGLNFIYVPLQFSTIENLAILDLGSTISLQNWQSVDSRALRRVRNTLEREWKIAGAIGEFTPLARAIYPVVQIGERYWEHREIFVPGHGVTETIGR